MIEKLYTAKEPVHSDVIINIASRHVEILCLLSRI